MLGVLERADVVAHRRRCGRSSARARSRRAPRRRASSDVGQLVVAAGDGGPRQLGRQPPALGGHRARGARGGRRAPRTTSASAPGRAAGTTIPAPPLSSSTACGNAVATTGRPAATASTSTPEVTWSSRVVRQDDEVGGADQPGQRRRGRGTSRRTTPTGAAPVRQPRRISMSRYASPSCAQHLRVGGAGDQVRGRGRTSASSAIASIAHSMPLPGPSSPHVSSRSRSPGGRSAGVGVVASAASSRRAGSPTTLAGVDVEVLDEAARGRARSSRRPRRRRRRPARAPTAGAAVGSADAPCGRRRSTAPTSASRTSSTSSPSRAAVDAVLVLHDGDVDAVERVDRGERSAGAADAQRRDDERILDVVGLAAAHDVDGRAVGDEPGGQRGRERGDAARRRRERRQDPERASGRAGRTTVHEGTTDHDELLTSAQSRRRACEGRRDRCGRPAQARRLVQEGCGSDPTGRPSRGPVTFAVPPTELRHADASSLRIAVRQRPDPAPSRRTARARSRSASDGRVPSTGADVIHRIVGPGRFGVHPRPGGGRARGQR